MKYIKLFSIVLGLFVYNCLFAQDLPQERIRIINLIENCLDYTEFNPIHKVESDMLLKEFKNAIHSDRIFTTEQNNQRIDSIFNKLYHYTTECYEDSPDYRRAKIRRMFCFTILALYSDFDKAPTLIEYAKLSLIETIDDPELEFMQDYMLGLYWLEILIEKEQDYLNLGDFNKIEEYLNKNRTLISESNYNYSQKLLIDIKRNLN